MPALTKTQLDHAKHRLAEAKNTHVAQQIMLLGQEPEQPELTEQQKQNMIRNGTAVLRSNFGRYTYLHDAFDYPLPPELAAQAAAYKAWEAKCEDVRNKADAIEQGVIDELVMSPDGMAALKRIADAFKSES